jgi:hypothetical protein
LELDALVLLRQHPVTVSAAENQFSLTCAASITGGATVFRICNRILVAVISCWIGLISVGAAPQPAVSAPPVVLENEHVKYLIDDEARNLSFLDMNTGRDYLAPVGKRPFMTIQKGGRRYAATGCRLLDGKLLVSFAEPRVTVVVAAAAKPHYFVFDIESVSDPAVEEVAALNLAVTASERVSGMSGVAADRQFAVALRTLDLQMLGTVSGNPAELGVTAFKKYGLTGGKFGLAGCPSSAVREVLKEMLKNEGSVWSPLGGPWALDAPENRGSYVFAESLSETNVEDWIALATKAGFAEIHLIGWEQTLGHYEPRKDLFPSGLTGLKAVVDKMHAAGFRAGMHTLTGCIAPNDPWASPVPDPRLAKDASFTLAAAVDEKSGTLPANEKPGDLDAIWAYGSRGNIVQAGQELIRYTGLAQQPPFGFTGCQRGVFGTKAQPHAKASSLQHLFVRYTSFLPDENSTLVDDLAARIGLVFNTCGFDMIYQDGAEGMAGGWHGEARMREAIFRQIKRPVLVEASDWGSHEWAFHSRIGAWDYPKWGLKRFVDAHCRANNDVQKSALLPAQLGWWVILGPDRDHPAETPDEFEYLCAKALAHEAPSSFEEISVGPQPGNARQNEFLEMFGRYERLRLSRLCPAAVRERLKTERADFHLVPEGKDSWTIAPTDYASHKFTGPLDGSDTWTVPNRYKAQPVKLKIEALYSVQPFDAPDGLLLADFNPPGEVVVEGAAPGVNHEFVAVAKPLKIGRVSARYTATNSNEGRRGAWCLATRKWAQPMDLKQCEALGVWVHGDGKEELLNFQLTNPPQFWDTLDEHYVKIDFLGWRYIELPLRERDAERYSDYSWPYDNTSAIYRSPLIRTHLSAINIYYNDLPARETVTCYLGPIKALPTAKCKLANPSVTVGGHRMVFPVSLESGSYLEFHSPEDCKVYDERGVVLQQVRISGQTAVLGAGDNSVQFACEGPADANSRAQITLISSGEPIARIPAGQ